MIYRKPNIAIVEDNDDLRDDLSFFLRENGYPVWCCSSAELFWRQLHTESTDIVLVDIGLPGEDGFGVVKHLNEFKEYGLIIITARGAQKDKLNGLQSGADLYLIKPINFSVLTEKIDTLWHRICDGKASADIEHSGEIIEKNIPTEGIGIDWRLGDDCKLVTFDGASISLSPQEYILLRELMSSVDQVISKLDLHQILFGHVDEVDVHRIDVLLSRLRIKLRSKEIKLPIRTLFGKGLVFRSND
ncbi:response regulator transcription factor [Marinomonas transparens]|uniref:Response regulator transcription factor n=1 Tax=Marinomonas transparens TaxID=2795388 RepID=A0A934JSZ9_9GAMM|nr:response regulator transcription factor [Marinomonas transparens]MBJ7539358.1 response regulator transcription factor [Marinomonas transparens]